MYMTHSFLFKGGEQPFCTLCNEAFSLEHILLHCSDLIVVGEQYFDVNSSKMLFREIHLDSIFDFLEETNVFNKLWVIEFYGIKCTFLADTIGVLDFH